MKKKIIIPIIIIIAIAIIVTILLIAFSTNGEKHIYEILRDINKSSYTERNFKTETLTSGKQTITYKVPKSAKILRESEDEKSYNIDKAIITIVLSPGKSEVQKMAEYNNMKICNGNNFDDFMNSKNVIEYQIGNHTYYRTIIARDGQMQFETAVGKKYKVIIMTSTNAKFISKNALMGIMDFE